MCLTLDRTIPLLGIALAPDAIAAAAVTAAAAVVTGDHAAHTADITGVAPEGGPIPVTHHDHGPLHDAAIGHNPAIEVGLNPREDALVINPILQITNVPSVL